MVAFVLAPPIWSAAAAASATVAAGAFLKGSQAGLQRPGAPGRPAPLAPLPWEGTAPGFLAAVQDWINGARIPQRVGELAAGAQGEILEALDAMQKAAAAVAGGVWDWLNRPARAPVVLPLPGLGANQTATITKSPRLVQYKVWINGWFPNNGGYYQGELQAPSFSEGDNIGLQGREIVSTTAWEGPPGDLWGRKVCVFYVRVTYKAADGLTYLVRYQEQAEVGTASFRIVPNEANTTGWTTTTNTGPAPPWPTALPDRTPAAAVPMPGAGVAAAGAAALPQLPPKDAGITGPGAGTGAGALPGIPADAMGDAAAPAVPQPGAGAQMPTLVNPVPPGTRPTTGAGTLAPPGAVSVPQTPSDAHIVNGRPITGAGARADLAGIAAEVGRVEQKLASLLRAPGQGPGFGDFIDKIGDIAALLSLLEGLFTEPAPGMSWEIEAPCNKDAQGNPVKFTYDIPEGEYIYNIHARLDALMAATAAMAGWRRPTCKISNPSNVQIKAIGLDPPPGRNGPV